MPRLFIAINLPKEAKEKLEQAKQGIMASFPQGLGEHIAKWVEKENLHLTLLFWGEVKNEHLPQICQFVADSVASQEPFSIKIEKVCYDTNKRPPRLVWTCCEKNEQLKILVRTLQKNINEQTPGPQVNERPFLGHITLGRLKAWVWQKIDPEEQPNIGQELEIKFQVNSIELMESHLRPQGPEYFTLQSFPLT